MVCERLNALERENCELKRANEIPRKAMGRLVGPLATAGADRQHPAGGVGSGVLSPTERVGHGCLTQINWSPGYLGRLTEKTDLTVGMCIGADGRYEDVLDDCPNARH